MPTATAPPGIVLVPVRFAPIRTHGGHPGLRSNMNPSSADQRSLATGRLLLLLAGAVLLAAALRDLTSPWESGMRGRAPAHYTDGAVAHTLHYGLGQTKGMPAMIVEQPAGPPEVRVNWHHPPLYWLYLALAAYLGGHEPWVLRLAHLLLFAPGVLALFALVRARCGEVAAGITALAFACTPLVAYFGPMVLQDGAVLGLGLWTMARFQRLLEHRSWRNWFAVAALFFVACSLDYTGYWWGPAMFVLACGSSPRGRAIALVFSLLPVALLAFLAMAVHYGLVLGGPLGFVRALFAAVAADTHTLAAGTVGQDPAGAARELLMDNGNWPMVAAAAVGGLLASFGRGPARPLAWTGIALLVPGVLNVTLMFAHALAHVFWSIQGFAGFACLLAAGVLVSVGWLRSGGALRAIGLLGLLGALASCAFGVLHTHRLITMFAFRDNGTPALLQSARPYMQGCAFGLTSAPAVPQLFFGPTQVWAAIDTAAKLDVVLTFGRAQGIVGSIAFVVAPGSKPELEQRLQALGKKVADAPIVYRLQL